jgi:hypothetical protein
VVDQLMSKLILPRRKVLLAAPSIIGLAKSSLAAWPGSGRIYPQSVCDPSFSLVTLLCHFDGTNGQTTFTDNSNTANTLTAVSATVDTATPKFGTGAGNFTTIAASRIGTGNNASFAPGSGQFTWEAWGYATSFNASTGVYVLFGNYAGSTLLTFDVAFVNGSFGLNYSLNGTSSLAVQAAFTPTLSTWVAYAVDRDASNVVRVYVNGAVVASATVSGAINSTIAQFWIGNDGNINRNFPGELDEMRFTKGLARYAGAYTPATAAFPNC